jgi:hypothetical protein
VRLVIIHRDGGEWTASHNGHFMFVTSEPCWALPRDVAMSLDKLWRGWRIVTLEAAREDYGLDVRL